MCVVALTIEGANRTVVTDAAHFDLGGNAILINELDEKQLQAETRDSNVSYELRIGSRYRDHRDVEPRTLRADGFIEIPPRSAVIIRTQEHVHFPRSMFGHIVPKVSLLQRGIANTPTKIDPGYNGALLITTFNHGSRAVRLKVGRPFCSMFVMRAERDVRTYARQGKDLEGEPRPDWRGSVRDFLDRNAMAIQALHGLVTIALTIYVVATGGSS